MITSLSTRSDIPIVRFVTGWLPQQPVERPYYRRLGFRVLSAGEITPGLREVRRREAAHGLDRWPRVCMRRDL